MKDAKDLLVQELTLAKLEGHDELRQIKIAALSLGIGIGVAAVGGILLSVMLVMCWRRTRTFRSGGATGS